MTDRISYFGVLLPFLVLIGALLLLGYSWSSSGHLITIRFTEGHGIKAGDAIRYHGVVVGEVTAVELLPGLSGIEVVAVLHPQAARLAVEGSRFWIARPQLDLTRISGLDTVVGGKYIEVIPGKGALRKQFTGASEPLLPDEPGALQVILQHKHSGRLQPGLPVLHRVVKVGQVVSSELAGDASAVEIHIRIHPPYRSLVRSNSKFWNSSGVKLNLDGLQMENLVTVVFGGLTFATPSNPGNPVADGKRFWQEDKEPDGWKDWNPSIPLISPNLPEGMNPPRLVRAVLNYKVPGRIYGTSAADQRGLVLPVGDDWLLGPAELLNKPLKAIATEPATVSFEGISLEANPASENAGQLVWLKLTGLAKNSLPKDRLRAPEKLEPCVLVSDAISESVFITENHLEETQVGWLVRKNTPASMLSREAWHGAAAVSTRDGKVIGIFLFSEKSNPHIVPLTKELTNW